MNTLPSKKDISPYGDLDSTWALKHFLGKRVEQILELFRKDRGFNHYIEDLAWMGGYAFSYYFQAVIQFCYEELEKAENIVSLMDDLMDLLKLRAILDSNSRHGINPQIVQVISVAIKKLEKSIKDVETIPLQDFYELSWLQQRKLNRFKEECTNCVTALRQLLK